MSKDKLINLQKEWYKKLKDEGFEDIEYFDKTSMEPQDWLKGNSKFSGTVSEDQKATETAEFNFNSTRDYFLAATHWLITGNFQSPIDKRIWELHSNGESLREIGEEIGYSHPKVLRIINKYKKQFLKN